jgi:hypothetical protein
MPPTLKTQSDNLMQLIEGREVVTMSSLRQLLGVSERTMQRRLRGLVDAGVLRPVGHGRYSRSGAAGDLGEEAAELVGIIDELDADAHLTGYDILVGYAHQFVYQYPHLIYCHPPHLSGLTSALTEAGWRVLPAGSTARRVPLTERTVIVRAQPQTQVGYPIDGHLARPEKAWVDLLREVRRSGIPFDYEELGRILRAIERAGGGGDVLTGYARRAGYLDSVRAARGEVPPTTTAQRQLAGGYAA